MIFSFLLLFLIKRQIEALKESLEDIVRLENELDKKADQIKSLQAQSIFKLIL